MKTKTKASDSCMALKIDINKAYDMMDWEYMWELMSKMDFRVRWIQWMTTCVESVDYSILVNNEAAGLVIYRRRLHFFQNIYSVFFLQQEVPFSPYIFIICVEGLSSLIRCAEKSREIRGMKLFRGSPSVSHPLFADDCFFFFQVEESQTQVMKNIITSYEAASGQTISFPKSVIYFIMNVTNT